jgi:hypothetical protein
LKVNNVEPLRISLCSTRHSRFAKRQTKKRPSEKFRSAQSVYASNTVTHKELVEGSFKMSEIAIVKTGNLQDEICCHLNIRYTPVNVY